MTNVFINQDPNVRINFVSLSLLTVFKFKCIQLYRPRWKFNAKVLYGIVYKECMQMRKPTPDL